jgi:hypothetical protein
MDELVKIGENTIRDEQGKFLPGHPDLGAGRPPETPEKKIVKRAIKEIVAEYKENLANALPQIEPVVIAKAIAGDMVAVKEIHDRVMDKARQPNDLEIKGSLIHQIVGMKIIDESTTTNRVQE